ncbi:MAG: hypothetical protein HZA79_12530 [Sphingobacteriales bacterium]|nr:hypothetical protein [Sphingobacteriales bacterium]
MRKFAIQEIEFHDAQKLYEWKKNARNVAASLFLRNLNRRPFADRKYSIRIFIADNAQEHLQVSAMFDGVIPVDYFPDYSYFSSITEDKELVKFWVGAIYSSLLKIADLFHWPADLIIDSYNDCIRAENANSWYFKDKLLKSPGGSYYLGVHNLFSVEAFEAYIVLFNEEKKEIARHLIYRDKFGVFQVEMLKWVSSTEVAFKFCDAKKVFTYSVSDMLNNRLPEVPGNISLLFK